MENGNSSHTSHLFNTFIDKHTIPHPFAGQRKQNIKNK